MSVKAFADISAKNVRFFWRLPFGRVSNKKLDIKGDKPLILYHLQLSALSGDKKKYIYAYIIRIVDGGRPSPPPLIGIMPPKQLIFDTLPKGSRKKKSSSLNGRAYKRGGGG